MDAQPRKPSKYSPGTLRDLRGVRFGALVVERHDRYEAHETYWWCRCDCGERCLSKAKALMAGRKKSCGIKGHRWVSARAKRGGLSVDHRAEYATWYRMKERCENPKHHKFPIYGARGITVCQRWQSFAAFFEDMGSKPGREYTIERKNNDLGYEPGNCRWATMDDQRRNTRRSVRVDWCGEKVLLVDLCRQIGVGYPLVYGRLKAGWLLEEALSTAVWQKPVDTSLPSNVETTHADAGRGAGVHPPSVPDDAGSGADSADQVCRVGGRVVVEI